MPTPLPRTPLYLCLFAFAAAVVSGAISAWTLNPLLGVLERLGGDGLVSLLSSFALTAGLAFGVIGGAFMIRVMRLGARTAAVLLATSMIGIAAAVYVALLSFDNTTASFVVPYGLASPIGALIVALPFVFLARVERAWRTIALATLLPTLWAMGVAAMGTGDAVLEVPMLAALYIGWQGIVLVIFATAPRAV